MLEVSAAAGEAVDRLADARELPDRAGLRIAVDAKREQGVSLTVSVVDQP